LAIVDLIRFSDCGARRVPGTRNPGNLFINIKKGKKMFGKVKKVFFTGVFGIMYVSFIAQIVYVLGWGGDISNKMLGMGLLSLEWMILIAARYLSKRSSTGAQYNGYNNRRR